MPEGSRERLRHILVTNTARTERFTSPKSGRTKPTKTPPRDRQNHAELLVGELTSIEKSVPEIVRDQKAFGLGAFNGIYLSFESEPDFDLKFDSLEFQPSGIELCSVKRADNRTIATVFVPEGKLVYFLNKITAYRDEDTDKGKPKKKQLVESISHVRLAALEALWTDPAELFPASLPKWAAARGQQRRTGCALASVCGFGEAVAARLAPLSYIGVGDLMLKMTSIP